MSKPSVTSKATNTENSAGFAAGIARNPSVPAGSSKTTSGYKTADMSGGESTTRPIQTEQNDVHYDKNPIPKIPASKNVLMQPTTMG